MKVRFFNTYDHAFDKVAGPCTDKYFLTNPAKTGLLHDKANEQCDMPVHLFRNCGI